MPTIAVSPEVCVRCGACVDVCYARDVFEMTANSAVATNPDHCRLCGHCIAVCPVDAITIDEIPIANCPPIEPDRLPSVEELVTALRARRSIRRFQDRPVPDEVIRELISSTRWIPTGFNRQYVDWVVLNDEPRINVHRSPPVTLKTVHFPHAIGVPKGSQIGDPRKVPFVTDPQSMRLQGSKHDRNGLHGHSLCIGAHL